MNEITGFTYSMDGQEFLLSEGPQFRGWLCYKHPDGQWVTLRKPNPAELEAIFTIADAGGSDKCEMIARLYKEAHSKEAES